MYILKNAIKNIARNKGRNILVGLVLTAIIASTVVGLVINNTASAVISDYRTRFGSRVRITTDTEMFLHIHDLPRGTPVMPWVILPPEQVIAFAQSQYLLRYNITAMASVGNDYITAIGEEFLAEAALIAPLPEFGDDEVWPKFRILGGVWDEFETGERVLFEGRMPQADGEALIGQELAELNGFVVGDVITLTSYSRGRDEDMPVLVSHTLAITGIFWDFTEVATGSIGIDINFHLNRRNEILTTADTLIDSAAEHPDPRAFRTIILNPVYYLRDPAYLPYFEAELREKGLDDWLILTTDEAAFNAIVEPVEGLRSILFTFVIIVLGLGVIILILVSSIAIRERKYEVGVLRAMGMKKGKVVRGLLYEMGALTVICLMLGLVAGTIAAQPVADNLLQQQVEIVERAAPPVPTGFELMDRLVMGPMNAPEGEPLSEINVGLGIEAVLQIAAVAVLLAFVSSAIGLVNIMRYEPIKILMERN
jgi:putative ABC transport system permease protein